MLLSDSRSGRGAFFPPQSHHIINTHILTDFSLYVYVFILCTFVRLATVFYHPCCCCCRRCCPFAVDRNQQNRYGRVFGDGPLVRIIGGIMCIAFCISRAGLVGPAVQCRASEQIDEGPTMQPGPRTAATLAYLRWLTDLFLLFVYMLFYKNHWFHLCGGYLLMVSRCRSFALYICHLASPINSNDD